MENVDDDGDARWFCSTCVARKVVTLSFPQLIPTYCHS